MALLAFVLLTLANAFFVVGEFSLVTVDRATIEQASNAGDRTARTVSKSLHELSFQLSAAQLGITLAALLTGYLAEPALARLLRPLIQPWGGSHTQGLTHVAALGVATLFSMLFGELVPKNAALARPMPLVRASAGPLRTFASVLGWLIRALNGSANFLVRRVGVEPHEELASARSPEELGLLAAISARAGAIPEDTAVLLRRTIRFGDKRAAEAMTPRVDVSALRSDASVADLLSAAHDTGFSRFPIFEETLDHVTGVVSVTDALGVTPEMRANTSVASIATEPILVPDSLDLDGVLEVLNRSRAALAIVVDEYGGTDGVVTSEDLVEELVGEIADEHDPSAAAGDVSADHLTVPATAGPILVDGVLREDELAEQTGFTLPPGPYETLAGFLMAELGHIPVDGETLRVPGWEFTVVAVEKRRIEQVRVTRTEPVE
ncbi:MAG TPA: hemolysin family protein [Micromonosporaceae bacterium]|nr:hemolysin family protein [Micromonosporaceae bacterium]